MKYLKKYFESFNNTDDIQDNLRHVFIDYNPKVYFNNCVGERFFKKNVFTIRIEKIKMKDIMNDIKTSISYMEFNNYKLSEIEAEETYSGRYYYMLKNNIDQYRDYSFAEICLSFVEN